MRVERTSFTIFCLAEGWSSHYAPHHINTGLKPLQNGIPNTPWYSQCNPSQLHLSNQINLIMFNAILTTFAALCTLAPTAFAQSCFSGSQGSNVNSGDFSSLASDIANDNFNPQVANPFALNAVSSQSFTLGSAGVCVENDFIFENTHVFLSDVASGAQSVFNQCNAQGGQTTIHGDSGLLPVPSIVKWTKKLRIWGRQVSK
jgi:hypothetical protein